MTDDERAVLGAFDAFGAAFDRGDFETIAATATPDVLFLGSGEGEEAVGVEGIREMFARLAPQFEGIDFRLEWHERSVQILGDVALVTAFGDATLTGPRRTERMRYRLTGVLVRDGGRWRCRVFHGSEPAPW